MATSSTIVADLKSASTTGPSAASSANAIAAAGPIQDLAGHLALAILKAQELRALLIVMVGTGANIASGGVVADADGIGSTLRGVRDTLV